MVYILDVHGATSVWQRNGKKQTFEWHPGSLFAIPLNAEYQHFNGQGNASVRFFAVTSAPFMMNLFHNLNFIFANDFVFSDRFPPEDEEYFSSKGQVWGLKMSVNFVPNTWDMPLQVWNERGAGGRHVNFDLAGNVMGSHISEFPVGRYKKAHRHGPGAHVTILSGQGYSLLWPEHGEPTRVDWKPGSVVVPPSQWFHQHFNSGADPARYLALRWNSWRYNFVALGDDKPIEDCVATPQAYIVITNECEGSKISPCGRNDRQVSGHNEFAIVTQPLGVRMGASSLSLYCVATRSRVNNPGYNSFHHLPGSKM